MVNLNDKTISHFKILNQLGKGGMGIVYKALDLRLNRNVALKFLPPELSLNEENKELFINEAKSASALQHNNICTIHDIDQNEEGQLFIVMDYYEGKTLKELIAEKKSIQLGIDNSDQKKSSDNIGDDNTASNYFSLSEILDIIKQIAKGLNEAHQNGIIHRDIKPANIFITKDGTVKILDFGIAKLSEDTSGIDDISPIGTIAYMSPEQIKGEHIDHRADLWSLGVIFYEMLTGDKPFTAEYSSAFVYTVLNENYEAIQSSDIEIPKQISELSDNCLVKDRNLRVQSADQIIQTIENYEFQVNSSNPNVQKAFKRRLVFISLVIITLFIAALISYNELIDKSDITQDLRIGVLPFLNNTANQITSDWPILIQSLFTTELRKLRNIAVVDFLSINGLIESSFGRSPPKRDNKFYEALKDIQSTFFIDGTILQTSNGFNINANIINTSTGHIKFSTIAEFKDGNELSTSIKKISESILNFFEIEEMKSLEGSEINTWISGDSQNLEAIKAFLQACQYVYRGEPGGEKYLRKAIELDSNFISARIWLISGLAQRGRKAEVDYHFNILQKLESKANSFEKALIDWCQAYINHDFHNQAKSLEVALKYSPSNNILLVNLAVVKYEMDDYQGALEALSLPIKLKWSYPPVYLLSAESYIGIKRFDDARNFLEDHLDVKPVPPESYAVLSALYLREENPSEAENYFRLATSTFLQQKNSWDEINSYFGDKYLDVELYSQAVEYYKKVLESNPASAKVHEKLGRAYFNLNDKTAALNEFNEAIKIDSSFSNPHFMIAKIVDEKGENSHAIDHYTRFLRLDSLSKNAGEAKSRIKQLTKITLGEITNNY
jgi:serine/threonine protein kinase/Tfp pilus assembly protein PilF